MKKFRLKKGIHEGDYRILILTLGISLFGIIMEFSAGYYVSLSKYGDPYNYLKSAAVWFLIGWAIFIFCSFVDYSIYSHLAVLALIAGFVLLGLVFTPLGVTINNATRWIQIGNGPTIMPGEIIKTCMILFFSWFYAEKAERAKKPLWILFALIIAGTAFFLIYKQPNLSTALIVVMLVVGMMFLAGLPLIYVVGTIAAGIAGVVFLLTFKGGYMMERVTSFTHPFDDALGSGYQVVQGLLALGSGGVFGLGLGNSIQKAFYLPEAQSDFILPIIGEELGFVGVLCLLIAYLILVYVILSTAIRAKDRFGMLLAGGVGLHLGLQVILNVAVVTATAPPTGVVLPLISAGGNALILYMAELGIVYNISKQAREMDMKEDLQSAEDSDLITVNER